jgi:hypothetical protein
LRPSPLSTKSHESDVYPATLAGCVTVHQVPVMMSTFAG